MKSFIPAVVVGVAALLFASPAEAQRRDEHREVFDAMRSGKLLPVREIENRVLPSMNGAQYLGFDFDSGAGIYTLKFLRNGNVIWVEVDGHSGQVIGRSGR
ncbi:MAG: hypothetical protein C0476_05910 [Sphingomonas sp.]|nr:hypothetical protein [Sphingomonas sp.]